MRFNPVAEFVTGKNLIIPDTLSRHPQPTVDDKGLYEDVQAYVNALEEQERHKPVLECIREETEKDDSLQLIKHYIKKGWPQHGSCLNACCGLFQRETQSK